MNVWSKTIPRDFPFMLDDLYPETMGKYTKPRKGIFPVLFRGAGEQKPNPGLSQPSFAVQADSSLISVCTNQEKNLPYFDAAFYISDRCKQTKYYSKIFWSEFNHSPNL